MEQEKKRVTKKTEQQSEIKTENIETQKVSTTKTVQKRKIKNIACLDGATVHAKTTFYGKTYIAQIYGKNMCSYNALFKAAELNLRSGKYAGIMEKLLRSAIANAKQKGLSENNLYISEVTTGRGRFLKRRQWRGRGRSGELFRPFANVTIKLKEVQVGK